MTQHSYCLFICQSNICCGMAMIARYISFMSPSPNMLNPFIHYSVHAFVLWKFMFSSFSYMLRRIIYPGSFTEKWLFHMQNGVHSLCPAIWSKQRRWLMMSMMCLNPVACVSMSVLFIEVSAYYSFLICCDVLSWKSALFGLSDVLSLHYSSGMNHICCHGSLVSGYCTSCYLLEKPVQLISLDLYSV